METLNAYPVECHPLAAAIRNVLLCLYLHFENRNRCEPTGR